MDKSNLEVVTSPKLYLDTTFDKIDEEGLLSQRIFGPVNSYKCACGYYSSKTQHAGKRCPKCGVLCTDKFVRYTTFAKIILPLPVFKPSHKNNKIIKKVVGNFKYLLDTKQTDLALNKKVYLQYNSKHDRLKIVDIYNPDDCIPLVIKGGYSLYLAICVAAKTLYSSQAIYLMEHCYTYEALVIPPECRKVSKQRDSKTGKLGLITSEVNKFYSQLLKLCAYDWTALPSSPQNIRKEYIEMIEQSMYVDDPIENQDLNFYDTIIARYQKYINNIYQLIINQLSTKEGNIRQDMLGKTIDFCSRSHVVLDPSLKAYQIKMSRGNFIRLWFIEYMWYLIHKKGFKPEEVLFTVKLTENKITEKFPQYVDEFIEYMFSSEVDYHKRLVLTNRQPTLWRHGIPGVEVVGITEGEVGAVSPLFIEPLNMDFDGDTASVIRIHDTEAQHEIEQNAWILNTIQYEHNPGFLHKLKGESVYGLYYLIHSKPDPTIDAYEIPELSKLPLNNFDLLFEPTIPIKIGENTYSYGQCVFNLWCGFKTIVIEDFVEPNELSKQIYLDSKSNTEYHSRLQQIMCKCFWYASLNKNNPITFAFSEIGNLNFDEEKRQLKKLPDNAYIGQHLYKAIISNLYKKIPEKHFFGKLIATKLGKVQTQLARITGAIGYIANDMNVILTNPLTSNLIDGLDPTTFFYAAMGARKGLVDKDESTPKSGYLERSLVMNLSPVEIAEENCESKFGLVINILSKTHAESLIDRYYTTYDPTLVAKSGIVKVNSNWRLFTKDDVESSVGKSYAFRSPITCQTKDFKICKHCFGNHIQTPYIGIVTGQSLAERLTQLTLRTFEGALAA